jgi:hypothetical protein
MPEVNVMNEALLSTGGKTIYINNSGPGPKALIGGDETLGYFGEVTDTQLFGISQVAGAAGLYQGDDNSGLTQGANHWLKFIWNGKIIYIAKRPFRTNISWADLYAAGLVYGTRDNGKYPLATPKHQFIQMPKYEGEKLWVLKPRLVKGYDVDPVTNSGSTNIHAGEWSQLLGRCSVATDGGITPKFATFGYAPLGWTNSSPDSIVMETVSTNVNQTIIRGDGGSGQIMGAYRVALKTDRISGSFNQHFWRPVLELIPDTEAKDPYQLLYRTPGPFAPVITDVRQWTGVTVAQRAQNVRQKNWAYQLPQVQYSFSGQAMRAAGVRGTNESPTLKAFTITGSYVA